MNFALMHQQSAPLLIANVWDMLSVALPLNVMYMPALPAFARLQDLTVKRISIGNVMHSTANEHLQTLMNNTFSEQSFSPVFNHD